MHRPAGLGETACRLQVEEDKEYLCCSLAAFGWQERNIVQGETLGWDGEVDMKGRQTGMSMSSL